MFLLNGKYSLSHVSHGPKTQGRNTVGQTY